jgi:hypothetical protein
LVEDGKKYMKLAETFLSGRPSGQDIEVMTSCQRRKTIEIQVRKQAAPARKKTASRFTPPFSSPLRPAAKPERESTEIKREVKQAVTPPAEVNASTYPRDKPISLSYIESRRITPDDEVEEWERNRLQIKRIMGDDVFEIFKANLPASRPQRLSFSTSTSSP